MSFANDLSRNLIVYYIQWVERRQPNQTRLNVSNKHPLKSMMSIPKSPAKTQIIRRVRNKIDACNCVQTVHSHSENKTSTSFQTKLIPLKGGCTKNSLLLNVITERRVNIKQYNKCLHLFIIT